MKQDRNYNSNMNSNTNRYGSGANFDRQDRSSRSERYDSNDRGDREMSSGKSSYDRHNNQYRGQYGNQYNNEESQYGGRYNENRGANYGEYGQGATNDGSRTNMREENYDSDRSGMSNYSGGGHGSSYDMGTIGNNRFGGGTTDGGPGSSAVYGSRNQQTNYGAGSSQSTHRSWNQGINYREENQSNDRQGQHFGKGPKGYKRSDERIREDVCEALTNDHRLDATDIDISVEGGVVTLSGTVDERRAKRMAEDIIEHCSGVTDVKNELKVSETSATSGSSMRSQGDKSDKTDKNKSSRSIQ